jgi:hypothetical protein
MSINNSGSLPKLPVPLHEMQRFMNSNYYSQRHPDMKQGLGFETPSHGKKYAQLNAREFAEFAQKREGKLSIYEFGAADGAFAANFLNSLQMDAPEIYLRTSYFALDKYGTLKIPLESAIRRHANAKAQVADVLSLGREFEAKADYVFCHELFDDLASRVVSVRENRLHEIWFVEKQLAFGALAMQTEHRILDVGAEHFNEIAAFMRDIPQKCRITFPVDGVRALSNINRLLRNNGALRIFDYGFSSMDDLALIHAYFSRNLTFGPADSFVNGFSIVGSKSVVNGNQQCSSGTQEDTQLTTPLNFSFFKKLLDGMGFSTLLESHLGWASRIAGEQQVMPYHCAQGFAYNPAKLRAGEFSVARELAKTHRVFEQKSFEYMSDAIRRHGETMKAVSEVALESGIKIPEGQIDGVKAGEKGFVIKTISASVISFLETNFAVKRITKKITGENRSYGLVMDLIPESREKTFRDLFSKDIDELEQAGFNRNEMLWLMFVTPPESRYSGSMIRSSLTAAKKP